MRGKKTREGWRKRRDETREEGWGQSRQRSHGGGEEDRDDELQMKEE